jgi:molecular chaperone DnaK (HSP70)
VGIDLGTTNSVISIFRRGVAETILIEGRSTAPSVVSYREDGTELVGHAAKSRVLLDPENTVASAKRHMGDRAKVYHVGQRSISPVDVSAAVLKRLVAAAESTLGEPVRDAVITVPAYFTEAQREDTKLAGQEAGLNVLRLVPEPTAAAIAYGVDKGKDQTIMVYDLGGGTFDVSILTVRGNQFVVRAVGGDNYLGGDDFDQAVVSWAANRFKQLTGIDIIGNGTRAGRAVRQRLREAAEAAKIELSQSERALLSIPDCLGRPLELELTLGEYNSLIAPLLQRTIGCVRNVLHDAGMLSEDVDRVILVGGSTKNRAVRDLIAKEVKEPYIAQRVDEVVAHGAATLAANLYLPEEDMLPIEVTDVTGHSLGVGLLDDNRCPKYQPLIPRQTPYPCRRGMLGSTIIPWQQEVLIKVYRGEDTDPQRNEYLGELSLQVSPPQDFEVPIAAIFELDADGIIHFTAVQLPLDPRSVPLIEGYASLGVLDMDAIDDMIKSKLVQPKTVSIKS